MRNLKKISAVLADLCVSMQQTLSTKRYPAYDLKTDMQRYAGEFAALFDALDDTELGELDQIKVGEAQTLKMKWLDKTIPYE